MVLLEIPRASNTPVSFQGNEFIRIGSYRKKLKDYYQIERNLWRVFETTSFRKMSTALEHVSADSVLSLLDYPVGISDMANSHCRIIGRIFFPN